MIYIIYINKWTYIYLFIKLDHFDIHQKLTKHYKINYSSIEKKKIRI